MAGLWVGSRWIWTTSNRPPNPTFLLQQRGYRNSFPAVSHVHVIGPIRETTSVLPWMLTSQTGILRLAGAKPRYLRSINCSPNKSMGVGPRIHGHRKRRGYGRVAEDDLVGEKARAAAVVSTPRPGCPLVGAPAGPGRDSTSTFKAMGNDGCPRWCEVIALRITSFAVRQLE
jgi:hypothetical protein